MSYDLLRSLTILVPLLCHLGLSACRWSLPPTVRVIIFLMDVCLLLKAMLTWLDPDTHCRGTIDAHITQLIRV